MMKNKFIPIAVAVFVFIGIVTGTQSAHAQVASSTPLSGVGGYSTPCFYIRQTNEWKDGFVCNDVDYSQIKFVFDSSYREAILSPWRQHVFIDIPTKYGWSTTEGSK